MKNEFLKVEKGGKIEGHYLQDSDHPSDFVLGRGGGFFSRGEATQALEKATQINFKKTPIACKFLQDPWMKGFLMERTCELGCSWYKML